MTELLVVFPEIDNWYRGKNMEFSFDDAETVQSEENVHPVHLRHAEVNGKAAHVEHIHPHVINFSIFYETSTKKILFKNFILRLRLCLFDIIF